MKNKKIIGLTIIAIIVIALICIIVINFIDSKKIEKTQNNSQTEIVPQQNEQETTENQLIDTANTINIKINEGIKENISEAMKQEKSYKNMTIKDIKFVMEGGITQFTATIENNTQTNYEGETVTLIFTNKDGSEYSRLDTIFPPVDSGKSNEINAGTTADIVNAYNFIIESK